MAGVHVLLPPPCWMLSTEERHPLPLHLVLAGWKTPVQEAEVTPDTVRKTSQQISYCENILPAAR